MPKEKNIPTLNKLFIELEQVVTARTKKEMVMEIALQKLARLGNGDHYGNSNGNEIAKDALKKVGYYN